MQCANQYRQFWETQFDALATYLEATSEEEKSISLPTRTVVLVRLWGIPSSTLTHDTLLPLSDHLQ